MKTLTAEEMLKTELNIDKLSPLQFSGIIKSHEKYADQFKPKWISVENDPEDGELVIVVLTFKTFDPEKLVCVFADGKYWNAEDKDHSFDNVSHWMYVKDLPLPTKP